MEKIFETLNCNGTIYDGYIIYEDKKEVRNIKTGKVCKVGENGRISVRLEGKMVSLKLDNCLASTFPEKINKMEDLIIRGIKYDGYKVTENKEILNLEKNILLKITNGKVRIVVDGKPIILDLLEEIKETCEDSARDLCVNGIKYEGYKMTLDKKIFSMKRKMLLNDNRITLNNVCQRINIEQAFKETFEDIYLEQKKLKEIEEKEKLEEERKINDDFVQVELYDIIYDRYEINSNKIIRNKITKKELSKDKNNSVCILLGEKREKKIISIDEIFRCSFKIKEEIKNEEWKQVIYKNIKHNDFECSNLGRFRNKNQNNKILHLINSLDGYLKLTLNKQKVLTHRVIAETWIPNLENRSTVNHINGIKNDNRIENLEWANMKEQMIHAFETGLCNNPISNKNKIRIVEKEIDFENIESCAKYLIENKYSKTQRISVIIESIKKSIKNDCKYLNFNFEIMEA